MQPKPTTKEEEAQLKEMRANPNRFFYKTLEAASRSQNRMQIFEDFVKFAALLRKRGRGPEDWEPFTQRYGEDCGPLVWMYAAWLEITKQKPREEFLGDAYMEALGKAHNGQFFTPMDICRLMVGVTFEPEGPINPHVYEPACGSGRLLLAMAELTPALTFHAVDITYLCYLMTLVNMAHRGIVGVVEHGNTISGKVWQRAEIELLPEGIAVWRDVTSVEPPPPTLPALPPQLEPSPPTPPAPNPWANAWDLFAAAPSDYSSNRRGRRKRPVSPVCWRSSLRKHSRTGVSTSILPSQCAPVRLRQHGIARRKTASKLHSPPSVIILNNAT